MYTEDLHIIEGTQFSGGLTFDLYPFGKYVTRNLTSDKETGLGNWTDQEIKRAFTQGISRDGRKFLPFPMPWAAFAALKEDDQKPSSHTRGPFRLSTIKSPTLRS